MESIDGDDFSLAEQFLFDKYVCDDKSGQSEACNLKKDSKGRKKRSFHFRSSTSFTSLIKIASNTRIKSSTCTSIVVIITMMTMMINHNHNNNNYYYYYYYYNHNHNHNNHNNMSQQISYLRPSPSRQYTCSPLQNLRWLLGDRKGAELLKSSRGVTRRRDKKGNEEGEGGRRGARRARLPWSSTSQSLPLSSRLPYRQAALA
eukprot:749883-Hanusia_phi.AAC.2